MRRMILILLWALASADGPALFAGDVKPPPTRYTIETKDHQEVTGTLTFRISCKNLRAREWFVFAPVAPELPSQGKVKTTLFLADLTAKDQSPLACELRVARVPVKTSELLTDLTVRVTYQAMLKSRVLKPLPPGAKLDAVPALSRENRKAYLAELGDFDIKESAFKRWLERKRFIRSSGEEDIEFARRVFRGIKSTFAYEYRWGSERRASLVCQAGRSDCAGLSILFAAVMCANNIPARTLFGRWAVSAKVNDKVGEIDYFQWHVKAEFFSDSAGWIPVDAAQAILHDHSRDGLTFFGVDQGDFLTMHIDPNLVLDAFTMGRQPIHNLQVPAWWVTGTGSVKPTKTKEDWRVTATATGGGKK